MDGNGVYQDLAKFGYNRHGMNCIRFGVLFIFSVVSARAGTLSGTVRDFAGAVVSNAHIFIHWDPSGSNYLKDNLGTKQDVAATTDASGHFSVEVPPGFYDVFVTATAFTPYRDKVCLKGRENRTYDVKLKLSPVTLKELD